MRIDIQPTGSPGLVVSVLNLSADEALSVGSTVARSKTKLGRVVDLSTVETSALARYTHDLGPPRAPRGAPDREPLASLALRVLFVADVFGAPGRRAVEARLPALRDELEVDFCVVNGENAADGAGLTAKLATLLLARGADVVTTGNHVWRRRDLMPLLRSLRRGSCGPRTWAGPARPGGERRSCRPRTAPRWR